MSTTPQLSILKGDGQRQWIYPLEFEGPFKIFRRKLAWLLILIYLICPWITWNGHPILQFNLTEKQFILGKYVFWASDLHFFMPLFLAGIFSIFTITSLFGRLWCGFACPLTVFLEFVFEPLERWIEGPSYKRQKADIASTFPAALKLKKISKHLIYGIVSWWVANTFIMIFNGRDYVLRAVTQSPVDHPRAFITMLFITIIFYVLFAFAKELFCITLCPYARFQSVLTDSGTLLIAYDEKKGEPRTSKKSSTTGGSCIDCHLCVKVCPTGIDIRNGYQLECIGCAHCVDACSHVMRKTQKSPDLIRFAALDGRRINLGILKRPRVLLYGALWMFLICLFIIALWNRNPFQVDIFRNGNAPYIEIGTRNIQNTYTIKIKNREMVPHKIHFETDNFSGAIFNLQDNTIDLPQGAYINIPLSLTLDRDSLEAPVKHFTLRLVDEFQRETRKPMVFLGPAHEA